jgi:3-hydroxy-9,10-secoandrosta-1,3,5(10)-triene-9,17-dione monooxygenase reductase component
LRPVGPERFRQVIGRFPTGVTVVTAMSPDGPVGMTANAVTSLSLDPLLLLVCFDNGSRTLPLVRGSRRFGVNVLALGQHELARRFAGKLPEIEKFSGVPYTLDDGVPVIEGAHAWLGCDLEQLLPGGDHTIGIGAVRAAELGVGQPLVWYGGAYGALGV